MNGCISHGGIDPAERPAGHRTEMRNDGGTMSWEELCRSADRFLFRNFIPHHKLSEETMSQTAINAKSNGVNTDQMAATVQAVRQHPALAAFRFRASNTWISGGHNRSTIKSFYGDGAEDTVRMRAFTVDAGEPPVLLGEDQAPNPVEFLLHALAASLTTSLVYHAAARGIRIESLESQLEGDLDLRGFLGLSGDVRRGFQQIRARFTVKSDATQEQLEDLTRFSPVYDTIANPVPVSISIKTEWPG
jgi:uncharacterized OsmC-like protein